jgi:putative membrane protein
MGVAEVIPGVSGGTIAFITGIYERLLRAIRSFNPSLIGIYRKNGFRGVLDSIDALFLARLFLGMAAGFIIGLKLITHLLEHYPVHIWSFFFGLILASVPLVGRMISKWGWKEIFLLALGTIFVYWVSIAAPSHGSESTLFVFFSGILAVSALMLPGLSGSFVLLLLGMYTVIMPAINEFLNNPFGPETAMLFVFGLGLLTGLFSFARFLSWTFARFKNQTLALLTGFLLGSLNKVWPWQRVLETRINSKGEEKVVFTESVSPNTFSGLEENFLYGNDPHILAALLIIGLAALSVYLLDRMSPAAE